MSGYAIGSYLDYDNWMQGLRLTFVLAYTMCDKPFNKKKSNFRKYSRTKVLLFNLCIKQDFLT